MALPIVSEDNICFSEIVDGSPQTVDEFYSFFVDLFACGAAQSHISFEKDDLTKKIRFKFVGDTTTSSRYELSSYFVSTYLFIELKFFVNGVAVSNTQYSINTQLNQEEEFGIFASISKLGFRIYSLSKYGLASRWLLACGESPNNLFHYIQNGTNVRYIESRLSPVPRVGYRVRRDLSKDELRKVSTNKAYYSAISTTQWLNLAGSLFIDENFIFLDTALSSSADLCKVYRDKHSGLLYVATNKNFAVRFWSHKYANLFS